MVKWVKPFLFGWGIVVLKIKNYQQSGKNSAAWTANKLASSSYLKKGENIFFIIREKLDSYRGKYKEIATRIADTAENPIVKSIYKNVSVGTGDKWNPSDIMALDSGSASTIEKNLQEFDPRKISKASREIYVK